MNLCRGYNEQILFQTVVGDRVMVFILRLRTAKIDIKMPEIVASKCTTIFLCIGSDIFLHRDKNLMPQNPAAWSAWNFLGNTDKKVCLTYWLNVLQVSFILPL